MGGGKGLLVKALLTGGGGRSGSLQIRTLHGDNVGGLYKLHVNGDTADLSWSTKSAATVAKLVVSFGKQSFTCLSFLELLGSHFT
jgi:hypothetical protein